MKTTLSVMVESTQGDAPVLTRRSMSFELDTDRNHYSETVISMVSNNVTTMVERALTEHEKACAEAAVKQLSVGTPNEPSKENENVPPVQPDAPAGTVPEVGDDVQGLPEAPAVGVGPSPS